MKVYVCMAPAAVDKGMKNALDRQRLGHVLGEAFPDGSLVEAGDTSVFGGQQWHAEFGTAIGAEESEPEPPIDST